MYSVSLMEYLLLITNRILAFNMNGLVLGHGYGRIEERDNPHENM